MSLTDRELLARALRFYEGCPDGQYDELMVELIRERLAQQEPAAWKWQQAPIRTAWGDDMVVASVAIDKDHTLSLYCERDQTPKVDAMFALAEQPTQQEPVAAECKFDREEKWVRCEIAHHNLVQSEPEKWPGYQTRLLYTSPQPAQRTWVGLTDEEIEQHRNDWHSNIHDKEFRAIEAKLRSKNEDRN